MTSKDDLSAFRFALGFMILSEITLAIAAPLVYIGMAPNPAWDITARIALSRSLPILIIAASTGFLALQLYRQQRFSRLPLLLLASIPVCIACFMVALG